MFSGKSIALTCYYEKELRAKRNVVVFKPKLDKRDADYIVSHSRYNEVPVEGVDTPGQILEKLEGRGRIHLVLLDELHFFNDHVTDMIEVANSLNRDGIDVVVAFLDQDSEGRPWEIAGQLMGIADEVMKLRGVCMSCGSKNATRSFRKSVDEARVLLGGADKYEIVCSECFCKKMKTRK